MSHVLDRSLDAAIERFEAAPPGDPDAHAAFLEALAGFTPSRYDPRLAGVLERVLRAAPTDDVHLARIAGELLVLAHAGGDAAALAERGAELIEDPLGVALLSEARNVEARVEVAVRNHRRALALRWGAWAAASPGGGRGIAARVLGRLVGTSSGTPVSEVDLRAACVIALHGGESDWVMDEDRDETALVAEVGRILDATIPGRQAGDPALVARLVLYAMYRPLSELAGAASLAGSPASTWPEPVRPVVDRGLIVPLALAGHRDAIEGAGESADPVSRAVRAQYEQSPYPRWRAPPRPTPTTIDRFVGARFPGHGAGPADAEGVLVAGCGTGFQAITVARRFPGAPVVATDISRSSLAYARHMARALGVANLRLVHDDLLDTAALGRRFGLIECVGVLHHMADPRRGLAALVSALAPAGLLRLGLYSEAARAALAAGRARIAELGVDADPGQMRRYRSRILFGEEPGDVWPVMRFRDFYNLNEFRDMLFHVCEHRFDLPGVASLLAEAGLEFMGFDLPDAATAAAYRAATPDDPEMLDLTRWEAFERARPDTFRRMYVFWCRRAG